MPELENVILASGLVVRPGDVLVVGMSAAYLSQEQVDTLKSRLHEKLPDLGGVVLITQSTSLAVQRQEPADA